MKALLLVISFIVIFELAGYVGGVVAPVLGPLFLASLVTACIYVMYRMTKAGA